MAAEYETLEGTPGNPGWVPCISIIKLFRNFGF
jgi:hypothetical protein